MGMTLILIVGSSALMNLFHLGGIKQMKTHANRSSVSEFGDDNFAIGNWEQKEFVSRDGHMKVQA